MSRIQALRQEGQSIWLDYIERSLIQSGELQQLVNEGITGVTSNPTIFQAAIDGSDAYAADLERMVGSDLDAKSIFEELAVDDIRAAADVLRPVYEATHGVDGFVSLEVAPDLAYDAQATQVEALRLWNRVDRPNLMIKVPAAEAGIPAIRYLIAAGVNVNVTLIFGLERYAAVKEAYVRGLEDRAAAGQPLDTAASVASFFVSRVDTNVDSRLQKLAETDRENASTYLTLQGQVAVANAKLAYAQFQEFFAGSRWQVLLASGARVQRPLWASTSTKNPAYPPLLYVDNLIGPHTVNTMPPTTLKTFRETGTVARTVDQKMDEARRHFADLKAAGICIQEVTAELETEGVRKFADSFQELIGAIDAQSQGLTTH